jgi:hypothetical protein
MTAEQHAQALRLVDEYVRNMQPELAEQELGRMRQANPSAHSLRLGRSIRARQGAVLSTARPDAADRVRQHAERRQPRSLGVWHDPLRDFGLDALKAHYDHGHRHA